MVRQLAGSANLRGCRTQCETCLIGQSGASAPAKDETQLPTAATRTAVRFTCYWLAGTKIGQTLVLVLGTVHRICSLLYPPVFIPALHRTMDLPPRRKRQPRTLNYLSCTFCRKAKVKVRRCQNELSLMTQKPDDDSSVFQTARHGPMGNAVGVLRGISNVLHHREKHHIRMFRSKQRPERHL